MHRYAFYIHTHTWIYTCTVFIVINIEKGLNENEYLHGARGASEAFQSYLLQKYIRYNGNALNTFLALWKRHPLSHISLQGPAVARPLETS